MRIVKPNAVIIDDSQMTAYQKIERCGRTCYKSEDKITADSAVKFVQNMLRSGHTAMLEHSYIYLYLSREIGEQFARHLSQLSAFRIKGDTVTKYFDISVAWCGHIISGSFRTFINLFNVTLGAVKVPDDLAEAVNAVYKALNNVYPELFPETEVFATEGTEYTSVEVYKTADEFIQNVHKKVKAIGGDPSAPIVSALIKKHVARTVVFTCDRGVSHEFVRHRPCGFAQESTRYCNYSKDKYGNEITVVEPCFYEQDTVKYEIWKYTCEVAEMAYFKLLANGGMAQQARSVLPNSLKTELVITATEDEWQHIVNLRYVGTTGAPHPQMVECMSIAYPQLNEISEGRIVASDK